LKFYLKTNSQNTAAVALRARAWIEIFSACMSVICSGVALRARAWIEISSSGNTMKLDKSPSVRGRGLKFLFAQYLLLLTYVTLRARAWIEIFVKNLRFRYILSPSVRGRGLKFLKLRGCAAAILSPSVRGRGLKYVGHAKLATITAVALRARAWIEIFLNASSCFRRLSRPPCEGVD